MLKLSNREKLLLKILIGVIIIVVGYNFIVLPIVKIFTSSDSTIISDKQKIEQLDRIYNNYKELETKRNYYMSLLKGDSENISTLIEQCREKYSLFQKKSNQCSK